MKKETRAHLAEAIKTAAVLEGEFTLRSGRKSRYYVDKYLFETQPAILKSIAEGLSEFVGQGVTRIAGAELGAVALAAAVSLQSNLPFIIIRNKRKGYGTDKAFEGVMEAGDVVLLVEDIATTGGQVLEAARTIEEAGAKVAAIIAVLDRLEGARENIETAGYEFHSLLDRNELGMESE